MDRTNPQHYRDEAVIVDGKRYEPINICECYNFCLGNAIKYILRAHHHKDGVSLNLQKALWYLKRVLAKEYFLKLYQPLHRRLLLWFLPGLEKSYFRAFPLAGKRSTVIKILSIYRRDFKAIESLFEPNGSYTISSLERTIRLIKKMLENECKH